MEEKFEKVKEILIKQKQEHLLKYNIEENEVLLDSILSIDFEQLNKLYKKSIEGKKEEYKKIEPISYVDKAKLTKEEKEKYENIGESLIKEGKYAVVTMAGGQRNKIRA